MLVPISGLCDTVITVWQNYKKRGFNKSFVSSTNMYNTLLKFTFKPPLDSGRYCILASHANDKINAVRHSQKVENLNDDYC